MKIDWAQLDRPVYNFMPRPSQRRFVDSKARVRAFIAANRCLGPNTLIDNPHGQSRKVSDIDGEHWVWSWDGEKQVIALAGCPFIKGYEPMYRVTLEDGQWFDCTDNHLILTSHAYVPVWKVRQEFEFSHQRSTLGSAQQAPLLDGSHSSRIVENFLCGYRHVLALISPKNGYSSITSIVPIGLLPVYDFHVPKWNNYVAAGVVHHNSGKSATGAYDTARKVLLTKPPRKNCPFWIISETYEMVCNVAWGERLAPFIEQSDIAWISWMNKARNWPSALGLKSGWTLELKSWAQGRGTFQARSIGGAWFDEQFPEPIFHETFARTSDHNAPIIITLTPIEPDAFLEERYERPPQGWEFFSMDLEENRKSRGGYLADDWVDAFIADTPLEFRDVRIHGKFATFEGAVFKDWRRDLHVVDPFPNNTPPDSGTIYRGIDFGFANPFCCLWAHLSHDDELTFFDEHYESRRFIEYHGAAINRRPHYNQGVATTLADPEDPEARGKLDEMGIFNECGPNAINRGIEAVMHRMKIMGNGKPRLRVTRNCINLIREIPRYHWPENTSENRDPKDTPVDKDNHAISAMRYIVYYLHLNGGGYLPPERIEGSGEFARSYSRVIG